MRTQDKVRGFTIKILLASLIIFSAFLQINPAYAFDYYTLYFLRTSYSPVARGMGGCEINSADEHSPINNPGAVGIFHLNKRISFYFPHKLNLTEDSDSIIYLRSISISLGMPVNLKDRSLGIGIAYSNLSTDIYSKRYSWTFRNDIETNIFTISAAYYKKARIGVGYTIKQTRMGYWGNRDWSDFGVLIEVPLREFVEYENFFKSMDRGNISHNIIPSIAFVKANIDHFLFDDFEDEWDLLSEINKYGFSISFISNYKESELFLFRIVHEINNDLGRRDIDFRKSGIEIGAWGTLYMRVGLWSTNYFDEKIRTYGFGFNLGGITSLLYSTGKIKTVNPIAQYILMNISISADYAIERSNDESVYENSDYFKICFSL